MRPTRGPVSTSGRGAVAAGPGKGTESTWTGRAPWPQFPHLSGGRLVPVSPASSPEVGGPGSRALRDTQGFPCPGLDRGFLPGMRSPSTPSLGSPGIVGAPRAQSTVTPASTVTPGFEPPHPPSHQRENRPQKKAALGAGDLVGGRRRPCPLRPCMVLELPRHDGPSPAALGLLGETLGCPLPLGPL